MLDSVSTTFLVGEENTRHPALLLSTKTWTIPLVPPPGNFGAAFDNPQPGYMRGTGPQQAQPAMHLLPQARPRLPENLRDEVFVTKTKGVVRSDPLMILG